MELNISYLRLSFLSSSLSLVRCLLLLNTSTCDWMNEYKNASEIKFYVEMLVMLVCDMQITQVFHIVRSA